MGESALSFARPCEVRSASASIKNGESFSDSGRNKASFPICGQVAGTRYRCHRESRRGRKESRSAAEQFRDGLPAEAPGVCLPTVADPRSTGCALALKSKIPVVAAEPVGPQDVLRPRRRFASPRLHRGRDRVRSTGRERIGAVGRGGTNRTAAGTVTSGSADETAADASIVCPRTVRHGTLWAVNTTGTFVPTRRDASIHTGRRRSAKASASRG